MKRQIEKTSKDSLAVYYELRFKIPIGTMLTTKEYDKAEDKLNEYKEDKYLINQLRTELLFESMIQDNSLITPRQGKMMWWMNAQYNGNFNKHIIQEA